MSKKNIASNYIYSSFYQILLIIIPFITAPYLSRTLQPTAMGINSYVASVVSVFTSLGLFGLATYSMREIAYVRNDVQKLSKTFAELLILRIIYFVITTIIYLVYAFTTEYFVYFVFYFITIISTFFDISWLYVGLEEFKVTVTRNIVVKILNVGSIFVFVKSPDDLKLFILLQGVYSVASIVVLFAGVNKRVGKVSFEGMDFKRHIKPAFKLFLPQIASTVYLQVGKIMIEALTDDVANVGFYDQAERVVKMPMALITALSTVMLPRISNEFKNNNFEKIKQLLLQVYQFSLFLAVPLMFGLIAIAPTMIPWFLGDGYDRVIVIMSFLAIIVLFISLSSVSANQYLTATNNTKILTFSYVVSAIVYLFVNYFLVSKLGVIGAAFGTVIAECLVFAIQIHFMKNIITLKELIVMSKKYFFSAIVMYVVCYIVGDYFGPTFYSTLLQIVSGMIVYFTLLLLLKDGFAYENLIKIIEFVKTKLNKRGI